MLKCDEAGGCGSLGPGMPVVSVEHSPDIRDFCVQVFYTRHARISVQIELEGFLGSNRKETE